MTFFVFQQIVLKIKMLETQLNMKDVKNYLQGIQIYKN